jgi:hypothetical protein
MREKIVGWLNDTSTKGGHIVALCLLFLVYLSIAQLVIEMRYQDFANEHKVILNIVRYSILGIFTFEVIMRLSFDQDRWKYFRSFHGIVDLLAVLPGLIGLVLPIPSNSAWFRAFRILRFTRALKFIRSSTLLGGVTGRLAPYLALALGFKGLMVAFEARPWWPEIGNLNIVIGVAGFALAILLGTKMRVISGRLYAVEDAICRIVGDLRDMRSNQAITEPLDDWARRFQETLKQPKDDAIGTMRSLTAALGEELGKHGVGGSITAGFHRDVEYVLHRAVTRTPEAYERFLRYVTVVYTAIVIFAVPGLTGFFASLLLIYVLGGMYLLIDDMDKPLDFSRDSLVSIDIEPLMAFNGLEAHPATP